MFGIGTYSASSLYQFTAGGGFGVVRFVAAAPTGQGHGIKISVDGAAPSRQARLNPPQSRAQDQVCLAK